jgi:hypothetical protein
MEGRNYAKQSTTMMMMMVIGDKLDLICKGNIFSKGIA